jgi:hypothetical protein
MKIFQYDHLPNDDLLFKYCRFHADIPLTTLENSSPPFEQGIRSECQKQSDVRSTTNIGDVCIIVLENDVQSMEKTAMSHE